ncbi:hypothetical protein [Bizionia sp.]|uniref:hypothetical protein n=1 Tax=Bizionia sp. TaxID=1954480 RepID=UPI003A93E8E2
MENAIQNIIKTKIPKGCIFDAHTIIEHLIQNDSDIYLSTYQNNWTTKYYHSEISKKITSLEEILIKRQGDSWSQNIHNKFTQNVCWMKL